MVPRMFGLYIHWPFCKARCPYCDYNAHVRERVDANAYGRALLQELEYYAAKTPDRTLTSIFFGGGTPSLMPAWIVEELIARAEQLWTPADNIEITLEANPTSSEAAKFQELADAGVNRLSLGIQSLNDNDLKFLGRSHNADEAKRAIELAAKHFPRYSFDLIYARPHQTPQSWRAELGEALRIGGDHFSFYQLTVEPQTAFFTTHARGDFVLPSQDDAAVLYDTTLELMADQGFAAYEVSSFARFGQECRHNLCYWRYHDYVGVGPGSHGRITGEDGVKRATRNIKTPEPWLEAAQKKGYGLQEETALDKHTQAQEMILMNLRLAEGIDLIRFEKELNQNAMQFFDEKELALFTREGFLEHTETRLSATPKGRNCLNDLAARILK